MSKLKSIIAIGAACMLSTSALADGHEEAGEEAGPTHFEYEATLSDISLVGGLGDEVYGASWTETITISQGENTFNITGSCVGMDNPGPTMFDRHFTCTQQTENGESSGAILFGCSVNAEDGSEMRCYGHFEGKTGAVEGHAAIHTAYYWFGQDGGGKVVGSGQWYK